MNGPSISGEVSVTRRILDAYRRFAGLEPRPPRRAPPRPRPAPARAAPVEPEAPRATLPVGGAR